MEALAAVGLVGSIIQFVEFGGKLISKTIQLYHSGALVENVDIETATKQLVELNKGLKDDGIDLGDATLRSLSISCQKAAADLLEALEKAKVKDGHQKWKSIRKALRSVWSKDEIRDLEQRLAKLKEDLNLHVVVRLSKQVSQFKREHLHILDRLDLATKSILDAIERRDVFQAAHQAQVVLSKTLYERTVSNINDTRQELIQEIRLPHANTARQERWLEKLTNATQAAFNSSERQHDPMCLHNTRVDILNEIRAWADGNDERRIFWLNGMAGEGKSTIARTIAREYFERGRLGASFFFSKGGEDVGHAGKFFTTIAFQLAKKSPTLRSYICEAISENEDIKDQSLRDQWNQLILRPLSRLHSSSSWPSYMLVVDALDECEGESNIRVILQLLAETRSLKTVQFRIFLTSRPETPIRHGFDQISDVAHQGFFLHNVSPPIIDHDIRAFLEYNFKIIGQERSLDVGWPGEQTIRCLIQKASGLFIWAATACRFVCDGKRFAIKRLATILESNIDFSSTTAPEEHLNEIYATVLKQSINCNLTDTETEDVYRMLRQILGSLVVLLSPLSADSLGKLLYVAKDDVEQTLEDLHAILNIPKDRTRPVRLHHPSFRDFLTNKERCVDPNFWIDEKQAHQTLADNSIRIMTSSLKQDICDLGTYGVSATDIDSSQVQQCLPQEVQYACLYWIQHLQKSGARLYDDDEVHQFLQAHVLHWLEALSWMRKVSEGIYAIISLESIALTSGCPSLSAFIHDIKRFALYGRSSIDQAPLQAYCSALIFTPIHWNAALQTLEDHSDSVNAVAFSPDGKVLASGSEDQTVKLWDVSTGAALQTLEGHSREVYNLAFSPDGKVLASASRDGTIKLWDAGTGVILQTCQSCRNGVSAVEFSPDGKTLASASYDWKVTLWNASTGIALQTLEGHLSCVKDVAFSPDGKVLASASSDGTIKLWDAGVGAALQTLEGHLNLVNAVDFSPDGKMLASASVDKTVKLWDAGTGVALQVLEGHSGGVNAVAFSSGGKVLASASDDGTVKLWDTGTVALLQTLKGHWSWVNAVTFSPDGKLLASASGDQTIKLWDAGTETVLQTLKGHSGLVNAVAFSSGGKLLASASSDWTVKLWDAGTGAALQTLEGHSNDVGIIVFSQNGKVLASASNDCTIKLWDTGRGAALQTLKGHSQEVIAVTFSRDGKVLASASLDQTVRLWDAGTGAALQTLEGHHSRLFGVLLALSADGKVLASASDQKVRLWNAGTGAGLQVLRDHSLSIRVYVIALSADGKVLASAACDRTIRLWDVDTGRMLKMLEVDATIKTLTFTEKLLMIEENQFSLKSSSTGQWITRGTEKVIWLHSEFRATCYAVHGDIIALGHVHSGVSFIEFAF